MIALAAALVLGPVAGLSGPDFDARLAQLHAQPLPQRIEQLTAAFLGTPYGELPLGDGTGPEPGPRWRLDEVDCQTYVETVLALANARSVAEAKSILDDLRYKGPPSFENRNHFTEAQWLPANEEKGYFVDEVPALDRRAPAETLTLVHDQWSKVPVLQRLANIRNIPDGKYRVRYLPLEKVAKHARVIESGSIILVVREHDPNRVVRISHMGFVVKTDKGLVVRHASSGPERAVMEVPLPDYLARNAQYTKWKVVGFALARPVDASLRVSQIPPQDSN